jgi:hypothetical protein
MTLKQRAQEIKNAILKGSNTATKVGGLLEDIVDDNIAHKDNHPPPTERDTRNEAAFSKNTAFNKDFGTTPNTVAEGNHTHADLHNHTNKGVLDKITETEGGGSPLWNGSAWPGGATYPTVDNYSQLPDAVESAGDIYIVINSSGVWFINRHEKGLYRSNGTTWIRLGDYVEMFRDDNFEIFDNDDATRKVKFEVGGVSTGTTRTITVPNKSGTLAFTDDISSSTQLWELDGETKIKPISGKLVDTDNLTGIVTGGLFHN